jgi:hypothetical protein
MRLASRKSQGRQPTKPAAPNLVLDLCHTIIDLSPLSSARARQTTRSARFYQKYGAPLPSVLLKAGDIAETDGSACAVGPSPRPIAMTTGGAKAMLAAAEALEAFERGEKVELPAGCVIDPTPEQFKAACREIGVEPPAWPLPEEGWCGPIMASAARPSRGKAYSDPQAENAVIGTITTGLFTQIPRERLIPVKAFTDEKCRIIYAAAFSLHEAKAIVTTRAVNEVLERSGECKRLNKLLDEHNLSAESRKLWDHEIDTSLAFAPSTLPVEDSLIGLKALYTNREDLRIGQALAGGTLSGDEARAALAALHQADGRNGELFMFTPSQILAWDDDPSDLVLANGYLEKGSGCVVCGGLAKADSSCN